MPAKVTLTVTEGKLKGKEFVFEERTSCIIGRSAECYPRLPNDEDHRSIGRTHCLLDINPPDIRIRDFGSLNGTYIKESAAPDQTFKLIGRRQKGMSRDQGAQMTFPEHDLKNGDGIRLGNTVFQVSVFVPTRCAGCSREIPEDQKAGAQAATGTYQCDACRKKSEDRYPTLTGSIATCAQCGRDVSRESGTHRFGAFICAACRENPERIIRHLLELAQSGNGEVVAIQGYEILKELGRGGMGAVYLARHTGTGEQMALKIMLPERSADERATQMFLREAGLTGALKHRHVVQLHDSGCCDGTFFFTLEFCDGGSVDRLMKARGGTLAIAEAGDIILQTLAGLDYAHNADISLTLSDGTVIQVHGLVHRDLKPQNIFLSCRPLSPLKRGAGEVLPRSAITACPRPSTWPG